jgi:hypothetical protein
MNKGQQKQAMEMRVDYIINLIAYSLKDTLPQKIKIAENNYDMSKDEFALLKKKLKKVNVAIVKGDIDIFMTTE